MKFSQPVPAPDRGAPAWTGLFFGLIVLVSCCQPFWVLGERSYSFYQMYCAMGIRPLGLALLAIIVLELLLCLLGLRLEAALLGEVLFVYHIIALGALVYPNDVLIILKYGTLAVPGCLLGSAGLMINRWLMPLDRRIFGALLAFWNELDP